MKKFLHLLATALIAIPLVATAHGPTRQQAKESITINASPAEVWALVGDFAAIDKWHPAVAKVEMKDDKTRVLTLKADGEPTITEIIKKVDNEKMLLQYKIIDMSVIKTITFNSKDTPYYTLPVNNYSAKITVKEKDGGSVVTWAGKFYRSFMDNPPVPEGQSDKEAVEAVTGVYKAGLENLKAVLEK